jgi:hypothetical protein
VVPQTRATVLLWALCCLLSASAANLIVKGLGLAELPDIAEVVSASCANDSNSMNITLRLRKAGRFDAIPETMVFPYAASVQDKPPQRTWTAEHGGQLLLDVQVTPNGPGVSGFDVIVTNEAPLWCLLRGRKVPDFIRPTLERYAGRRWFVATPARNPQGVSVTRDDAGL